MKQIISVLFVTLLPSAAIAGMLQPIVGDVSATVGSSYSGPGDVVSSAKVWGGLRGYSNAAAVAGVNAIRIRRTSDSTETDVVILLDGSLDVASAGTFCAATTCFVTTIYDQSGALFCTGSTACNLVQATAGLQPQLLFNCTFNLPCVRFTYASSHEMDSPNVTVTAQPVTFSVFGRVIYVANGAPIFNNGSSTNQPTLQDNNSTTFRLITGASGFTTVRTNGIKYAMQGVFNGASSVLMLNGADNSGTVGATGFTASTMNIGPLNMDWHESGAWASAFDATQRGNVNSQQIAYWGTSVSYRGPGDVVSGARAFWGLRAYDSTKAAAQVNAIRIRRASDSTETNITVLTTGALDVATAGTFCAATTCFATVIYDQSGFTDCGNLGTVPCDITQATAGNQPQLIFSCNGSLPCLRFTSASVSHLSTPVINSRAQAQPLTYSIVHKKTWVATSQVVFSQGSITVNPSLRTNTASTTMRINAGTNFVVTEADSAWAAWQSRFDGASTVSRINGTAATGNAGTGAITGSGGFTLGGSASSVDQDWAEIGYWPTGFDLTQRTDIEINQRDYWGF